MDKDFFDGCIAAKRRLATPDLMRKSEPAYKMGWNSWAPNTTPAAHVEAPAVPPANPASTPDGAPAADANLSFDQAIDFCKAAVNRYINGSFDAYTNPGTGTVHMLYTFPAETFYFDKCMNLAGHPMDSYNGAQ